MNFEFEILIYIFYSKIPSILLDIYQTYRSCKLHSCTCTQWKQTVTCLSIANDGFRLNSLFYVYKSVNWTAQYVKPIYLAVPGSCLAWGADLFNRTSGLHCTFHFYLPIVLIWLKYCWKGRYVASHLFMHVQMQLDLSIGGFYKVP